MKLALCTMALFGPLSLFGSKLHDAPSPETWRPLGSWEPYWQLFHQAKGRPSSVWMQLPNSVAALAEAKSNDTQILIKAGSAALPEGLELWLLEFDIQDAGFPDVWMMIIRDPQTDRVSARPRAVTNAWIRDERPRVRFTDLDDDGRNEISIRQFDHNGTMLNADVLEYYTVLPDLSLRMDLRQRTDLSDLWSLRESGAIRSQLLLSTHGKLRCVVWREDPRHGVPRTQHGWLDFARSAEGHFEVIDQKNELGPDEEEQRYEWTIHFAATLPKKPEAPEEREVR